MLAPECGGIKMKEMIAIAGFFLVGTVHAEVYKCQKPSGGIEYQSTPCATGPTEEVKIEAFDPDKISAAQAKLAESVKQQAEREAAAAETARKERDTAAREAIVAGIRSQASALNRNTQALQNANQAPPVYVPYTVVPTMPPAQPIQPKPLPPGTIIPIQK
jgi:hypothetical protein